MCAAIPLSRDGNGVEDLLDLGHLRICQRCGRAILNNARLGLGARDGNRSLADHPADGHLRRGHPLALSDPSHGVNQLQVLSEILGLKAGQHSPEVVLW